MMEVVWLEMVRSAQVWKLLPVVVLLEFPFVAYLHAWSYRVKK